MSSKGTVLVVDDNDANRLFAQTALEDEGFIVHLAGNGDEALAAFRKHAPDCVLLDVRMPGEDGFSVCGRLRAEPQGPLTPVLFLTALRDLETFDRAQVAGADDFLTKPVRPSELIARVQTALRFRQIGAERNELAALAKQQRDELYRVQLQKELLTSFIVHDLKNPVNAIDLHAQLILHDRGASASTREAAGEIRHGARQLSRLILNLLDVAKSAEGRLVAARAPTDVSALIDAALHEAQVEAQARDVKLAYDAVSLSAPIDRDLIQRTLANLLENAIRHSPTGGRVSVALQPDADAFTLTVRDDGPGVPEHMREKIFDRFVQVDEAPVSTSRQGRGLGLTFCKLAVEAHGGTIRVDRRVDTDGRGAVFVARVPFAG